MAIGSNGAVDLKYLESSGVDDVIEISEVIKEVSEEIASSGK